MLIYYIIKHIICVQVASAWQTCECRRWVHTAASVPGFSSHFPRSIVEDALLLWLIESPGKTSASGTLAAIRTVPSFGYRCLGSFPVEPGSDLVHLSLSSLCCIYFWAIICEVLNTFDRKHITTGWCFRITIRRCFGSIICRCFWTFFLQ